MKKRVSVDSTSKDWTDWRNRKFPGVYLNQGDSVKVIVSKLSFAHQHDFPVYINEDSYTRYEDAHDVLTFVSNVGYEFMFVDMVNDNKVPATLISIKLINYLPNTDMDRYGRRSKRSEEYYSSKKAKSRPESYVFHPHWASMNCKITKVT